MNIVLIGSSWLGAHVWRALVADHHRVPLVFAPLDDSALRDAALGVSAVADVAELQDDGATAAASIRQVLGSDGLDLIVSAHSFAFVPDRLRAMARRGAIGYHPSLLPLYRGRRAVQDALDDGAQLTGGSVYRLEDAVDTGDLLLQKTCHVRGGDTAQSLWRRDLAPIGVALLREAATLIERGADVWWRQIAVPPHVLAPHGGSIARAPEPTNS